jgi:phosphoglycolate phosphatase-like HAD superfamily hydrolase
MTGMDLTRRGLTALILAASAVPALAAQADPLPSWNPGATRTTLLNFVRRVTTPGPDFAPPERRIATFDNDGTLWVEAPLYTEAVFLVDRVKALVEDNPELRQQQPYKAVMDGDRAAVARFTEADIAKLFDETHSGMSVETFSALATDWVDTRKDGRFKRLYRELIYQPQLELLAYLRANGFTTFIVSGGGVDFMRTFTQRAYGIPPHQVIGSSGKTSFQLQDDHGLLLKESGIGSVDDKAGKPVNIGLHIGQRPLLAFGNSDGDLEMLQYTTTGDGPRLGLLVHHDDAAREYAYDRQSAVGKLDKALDEALKRGWTVVSMKSDWKRIFPFDPVA